MNPAKAHDHVPTLKEYYEYTVHQIGREDELIHKRITWFLTFEGFLFAALSLMDKTHSINSSLHTTVGVVVPLLGFLVSLLAYVGVQSAWSAINDLREGWSHKSETVGPDAFPRPYGRKSFLKISYSRSLPLLVAAAWGIILIIPPILR